MAMNRGNCSFVFCPMDEDIDPLYLCMIFFAFLLLDALFGNFFLIQLERPGSRHIVYF
jgi:hypothetical protein